LQFSSRRRSAGRAEPLYVPKTLCVLASDRIIYHWSAMVALMCFCLRLFTLPFKSKIPLEAENAILRRQLIVLERRIRGAFASPIAIGCSSFGSIVGFRQCWMPSDHPTRNPGAVAPCWFSSLLALELPIGRWSVANRFGTARADPRDQRRPSAVGNSTYPWRIAEARFRSRSVERGEVHDEAARRTFFGRCLWRQRRLRPSWDEARRDPRPYPAGVAPFQRHRDRYCR
jgi:hypothetical protein